MINENLFNFLSTFNYQKIAVNATDTVSIPNHSGNDYTEITIPHNLNYIPSTKAWYDPELGKRFPVSVEQYVDDTTFESYVNLVTCNAYLTTENLILRFQNSSGASLNVTYWARIYYDI